MNSKCELLVNAADFMPAPTLAHIWERNGSGSTPPGWVRNDAFSAERKLKG